jgi:hypothetical protein
MRNIALTRLRSCLYNIAFKLCSQMLTQLGASNASTIHLKSIGYQNDFYGRYEWVAARGCFPASPAAMLMIG